MKSLEDIEARFLSIEKQLSEIERLMRNTISIVEKQRENVERILEGIMRLMIRQTELMEKQIKVLERLALIFEILENIGEKAINEKKNNKSIMYY